MGRIDHGLVVFVGAGADDGEADLEYVATKVAGLRIFEDESGKMNRSVAEVEGAVLAVSQFTLFGDARKGRRPSFARAMAPDAARAMYDRFVDRLREKGLRVETGRFRATMRVFVEGDGPVTILLDSKKQF